MIIFQERFPNTALFLHRYCGASMNAFSLLQNCSVAEKNKWVQHDRPLSNMTSQLFQVTSNGMVIVGGWSCVPVQSAAQKWMHVKSGRILTWAVCYPTETSPCSSSVCLSSCSQVKDAQEWSERVLILHMHSKAEVRLKFFPFIHMHTLVHKHSHTVSPMSDTSQQQVSEDRGHLCAGPPLLSSVSGHLCWGKTGREERADSLPLCSLVHTTETQNSFNQNASALASWAPSLCLSVFICSLLPEHFEGHSQLPYTIQILLLKSSVKSRSLREGMYHSSNFRGKRASLWVPSLH